jgi:hypothetical protein
MKRIWEWVKARWTEHKAVKGRWIPPRDPSRPVTPVVGIGEDGVMSGEGRSAGKR